MGQISSINFKKSNPIQIQHNLRILPPSYLIGGKFECNRNFKETIALKEAMVSNAIEKYTELTGQKFQAKSYEWSAVVNIKETTSMNDLENLSKHFQEKYGFQCYQIAIHRDEGHINEQGEKVINHHAHMEFVTLDRETGKNRQRELSREKLREMQTEVAKILGMERGVDKRISKRQRIEPRVYGYLKELEKREKKQELLNKKEYTQIIEAFRKEQIGKGFEKDFFRDLSNLKKNFQEVNQDQLSELLNDILLKHQKQEKEYQEKLEKQEQIIKSQALELEKIKQMFDLQGINYDSFINAQNYALNQKSVKNEQTIKQNQENASKREKELLYEQNKLNLINRNNMQRNDYDFLQDFYKIHSKDKELQEQPSLKVYQEPFKQMPDILSHNLWGDHPSILKDEAPLQTAKNYLKTLLDYLKNLTINKESKQEITTEKSKEYFRNKVLNFEKREEKKQDRGFSR
ncbi:mobilization protein [Campylobacter lari]|uniref:mobilization protein n=1 Tax=Campylobacter lari TaxID=201 RepID=UPI002149B237|nr:mobilization protein [Campylobacter lari]EMC9373709.1 mobilization protein [Campylobacter lari]MCR2059159.1 mobilization protein [Campylobacter lari subsp. concheus]